jgi:hypothetical protein
MIKKKIYYIEKEIEAFEKEIEALPKKNEVYKKKLIDDILGGMGDELKNKLVEEEIKEIKPPTIKDKLKKIFNIFG